MYTSYMHIYIYIERERENGDWKVVGNGDMMLLDASATIPFRIRGIPNASHTQTRAAALLHALMIGCQSRY